MASTAIAQLDAQVLIDRISAGAFLRDLAAETGIDKRRLSEFLRKHPDYPAAKECAIECQLDDAQQAIQTAQEQADIARAREMFRAAAWRAEREVPERWAPRQHITATVAVVNLDALLVTSARDLLQHEPVGVHLGVSDESAIDDA